LTLNVPAALSCGALLRHRSSFEILVAETSKKLKTSVLQTSHFFIRLVPANSKPSHFSGILLPRNNPKFLIASGLDSWLGD
jgi:hypothetical protein